MRILCFFFYQLLLIHCLLAAAPDEEEHSVRRSSSCHLFLPMLYLIIYFYLHRPCPVILHDVKFTESICCLLGRYGEPGSTAPGR